MLTELHKKPSTMDQNRRTSQRRRVRIPALCWDTTEGRNSGQGKELITKDICIEGIGFYSEKIYPIGSCLFLDVYLPGRKSAISCTIEIVRVEAVLNKEEFIVGAIFREISSEDKIFIASSIDKMNIYLLLERATEEGASDLHLTVGRPPMLRCDGRILPMQADSIVEGQVEAMLYPLLSTEQIHDFERFKELDFAFSPNLNSRFRVNMHWQKGFVEAAFRNVPTSTKSFVELGLPVEAMQGFCNEKSGLFLIAGSTGAGKTTTMSAMMDYINKSKEVVVVSIEDPIEYTFQSERSIIKQRELGTDTLSYVEAFRHVLRQDPDVICVGELLDQDCLSASMRAAETGHLVISVIHAPNATQTIERIVNFYPSEHSVNIRKQLASCLLGILYQVLLPGRQGGRVLATELLINNSAIKNLIREGKYSLIGNVLQTGRSTGMYPLKNCLKGLYKSGSIDKKAFELYSKEAVSIDN